MTLQSARSNLFILWPEFMEIRKAVCWLLKLNKMEGLSTLFRCFCKGKHVLSQREEELLAWAGEIFGSASETFAILDNEDIVFLMSLTMMVRKFSYLLRDLRLMESKIGAWGAYQALCDLSTIPTYHAKTLQTNVKVQNYRVKFAIKRVVQLGSQFCSRKCLWQFSSSSSSIYPLASLPWTSFKMWIQISRCTMSTTTHLLNIVLPTKKPLKRQKMPGKSGWGDYLSRVKRALVSVGLTFMKIKAAFRGLLWWFLIPMPLCFLTGRTIWTILFTLVHETGHSICYTRETQPYVYGDYSIFLGWEFRSTTNENILTEKLWKMEDDATRLLSSITS